MNIKNKIVCTIDPASDSIKTITRMVKADMDITRVSFSHGTHQEKAEVIQNIKRTEKDTGKRIPILQDLSGLKIQIGNFNDEVVTLEGGNTFTLTTQSISGNEKQVSFHIPEMISCIRVGGKNLLSRWRDTTARGESRR